MVWRWTGDQLLSKPVLTLLTDICVGHEASTTNSSINSCFREKLPNDDAQNGV